MRFYKVEAGLNHLDKTFIFYSEREIQDFKRELMENTPMKGWYIYSIREISFRDMEVITSW
jgi:hypothetical protein